MLLSLTTMLVACEQSFFSRYASELTPVFEISLQSTGADNQPDTITVSSSKDERNTAENIVFQRNGDNILLLLEGHSNDSTVITKLQASILFAGVTDPYDIAGSYSFPSDNQRVVIRMSAWDEHGWQTLTNPIEGQLELSYDLLSLTWKGQAANIKFPSAFSENSSGKWGVHFTYLRFGK